jgi:hypothetical protein
VRAGADAGSSAAPAHRPPRQLPAGIPDFTGCQAEVGRLLDILAGAEEQAAAGETGGGIGADGRAEIPVAMLTGPPGCGKTTVAVHAAHLLRERFPDGQLFADLRGSAAQRIPTLEVLARFLRALGTPADQVPAELDERVSLLRSQLASRRVLIVLDDAADEEHIRDLIPGVPGPAVLVTSRGRLVALPGAEVVELDVMPGGVAVELLGRIVGPERVASG